MRTRAVEIAAYLSSLFHSNNSCCYTSTIINTANIWIFIFFLTYRFLSLVGRTRTKDKYRVVYTDLQRLELEKEFHFNRYITITRKTELSKMLNLSERQVSLFLKN
jgi:hypothetical protein